MSDHEQDPARASRGQLGYLQLPARDVAASLDFYAHVFGWSGDLTHGSFEAPGLIGQWTTDRAPVADSGPLLWICADQLWPALQRVEAYGGQVCGRPELDHGERWLVEVDDPAGNRIGIVVAVEHLQAQPMVAVRDVEASSRWYAELLGLTSDHGGTEYERLLSGSTLVLQLHQRDVEHHHGRVADGAGGPGGGVLVWFGEVVDLEGVVQRADRLGAEIVRGLHRNPPEGEGNGPSHRELWLRDPDGHTVVVASPDGEAYQPS